jgi:hypothetical protein
MGTLKTDLWKKAYLIEFMSEDGKHVEDSFTFSVPPESEEITYSQRKSETKTFGGLHIDDYGLDAAKISLSGSTINQDIKRIYHPEKQIEWKSGEEEIYLLRDLLKKYKTSDNIERKIFLYDLSKTRFSRGSNIKNYWRVFPGDLKIRRASDRPFSYKYTIDFTAVDIENDVRKQAEGLGYVTTALDGIKVATDWIKKWILDPVDWLAEKIELGQQYVEGINVILEVIDSSLRDVANISDTFSNAILGYTDILDNMIGNANGILNIPGDATQKYMNIGLEGLNAALRLVKSTERLTKTVRSWDEAPEELQDVLNDKCKDIEDYANSIAAVFKSNDQPKPNPDMNDGSEDQDTETGIPTGNTGVGDGGNSGTESAPTPQRPVRKIIIVLSYGDTEVTLNSTDTLESLAEQYYGSPDKAIAIAAYNGVASIDELNPGDTIKIPILTPLTRQSLNRIYARPEDRDNYGRDIYLDSEGNTAASVTGDFKLTDGSNNLAQAILLRLRESVVKRIRLNSYGIRTNVSDPVAGTAYILSSIDLTVNADPRVQSVDAIKFSGKGDGLDVRVEYTDINRSNGITAGRA